MSKELFRWLMTSESEVLRDQCRLIDLDVIDSVVLKDDGTTKHISLKLDPCVNLTKLLSKGKIQAHLASHLYEVVELSDTVTLEHVYISDYEDHFTLSMSHPSTETLIGGTVAAYESGEVMFFPVFQSTSNNTHSSNSTKESVVDESTNLNKETKMTTQRTEHKVEQPTLKDGLIWTSKLNLSGDHPEGIVMIAGQCRILDSDGLVMHKYRELEDRPVSGKVIRRYNHSTHSYVGHVLELTTPKGWIPQNIWLHVITPTEYPLICGMELHCDFRVESTEEERVPADLSTDRTAQIKGWRWENNVMNSGPLFQVPDDYKPELSRQPTLVGKVFLESGQVLDKETSQAMLKPTWVHPHVDMFSKRLSVTLGTVTPSKYKLIPMTGAVHLVHLPDQDEYHLEVDCDFTLILPNQPLKETKVTQSPEDIASLLMQVDGQRLTESTNNPTSPDGETFILKAPKSSQTGDTTDNQPLVTPKQLIKEIYANRDRKIEEILQYVNNYFIRCVRDELTTDTDLKLVLESPVTKDLVHRLYHTLTDAGYVVEISDEKLDFTIELPPIE